MQEKMEPMSAYCGLICTNCPIHLATLEPDRARQLTMRESIALQCSGYYGMDMKPGDIDDCDGCRSGSGRIFSGCLKCGIRAFATGKNLESCAFCSDYACDILRKHFSLDPGAQARLEEIRYTNGLSQFLH